MDASNNNNDTPDYDYPPEFHIKPEQHYDAVAPFPEPDAPKMKDANDYAELQRLSQEYTPPIQGPLVGDLKSSKALAVEYANADPTYAKKTAVGLPARLAHPAHAHRDSASP